MRPFLNVFEIDNFIEHENGPFQAKYSPISEKIGAEKLGYNLSVVPPGKKVGPFHNHRVNEEMFFILEGTGTLRFGDKEYPLKKGDIIACPPGGRKKAHQIINSGSTELKYLSLSTKIPHEICEYPDSDKIMSMVGDFPKFELRHMTKTSDAVDYFEGENR